MFAAIFAFALVTAYAAEIPSYVNVCGRKNPNLNQCMIDNIDNLKDRICNGLADLGIPQLEPLNIERLVISDTSNSKIYINDVQITGLCDFTIKSFEADLDKLHFAINISMNRIYVNGTYDINIHLLVPLVHKAPIHITSDSISVRQFIHAEMANKGSKKHIYVSKVKANIHFNGYEAKYGFNENDLGQLGQVLDGFIGSNQEEFIQKLEPSLEEEIAKWSINIFNNLFKMFSYDELFPDRE